MHYNNANIIFTIYLQNCSTHLHIAQRNKNNFSELTIKW